MHVCAWASTRAYCMHNSVLICLFTAAFDAAVTLANIHSITSNYMHFNNCDLFSFRELCSNSVFFSFRVPKLLFEYFCFSKLISFLLNSFFFSDTKFKMQKTKFTFAVSLCCFSSIWTSKWDVRYMWLCDTSQMNWLRKRLRIPSSNEQKTNALSEFSNPLISRINKCLLVFFYDNSYLYNSRAEHKDSIRLHLLCFSKLSSLFDFCALKLQ